MATYRELLQSEAVEDRKATLCPKAPTLSVAPNPTLTQPRP